MTTNKTRHPRQLDPPTFLETQTRSQAAHPTAARGGWPEGRPLASTAAAPPGWVAGPAEAPAAAPRRSRHRQLPWGIRALRHKGRRRGIGQKGGRGTQRGCSRWPLRTAAGGAGDTARPQPLAGADGRRGAAAGGTRAGREAQAVWGRRLATPPSCFAKRERIRDGCCQRWPRVVGIKKAARRRGGHAACCGLHGPSDASRERSPFHRNKIDII